MTLSAKIINEDHRLEKAADELAKLRWHWTLDESNSNRVSFSEYAHAVGRSETRIRQHASAYAQFVQFDAQASKQTLQDIIDLQNVKQADKEIVSAVAKATGTSINDVRNRHKDDIERVRNTVADAREIESDFTPEREQEVIQRSAKFVAAGRKAEQTRRDLRKKSPPVQVLVVEGDLQRARDALTKALEDSHALDIEGIDESFLDGLRDVVNRVVSLAKLVQTALTDVTADVDWDKELERISGNG